jgi:cytochrome c biogenesis protein
VVQETFELKTGDFKLFHGPLSIFASVRLTVVLLSLMAATVLLGAWCPQESAVGQEKVIEQFGGEMALNLHNWGITDLFHTPYFLILVAVLSLNMIVGSIEKVFPKLLLLKLPLQFFSGKQIEKLPFSASLSTKAETGAILEAWQLKLQKRGFKTVVRGHQLAAEFGKIGRLAPTITHIGLLSLLAGVTLTSWTGFSGFKPVRLGDDLAFGDSEHSKLWIGKLPKWKVHVDSTKREDYESGEAKQWYSDLTVIAPGGKQLAHQQISVNNPLSYEGVDVYQSSWGMDQIIVAFNGRERRLDLRPMGKLYAAFLPLDADTILIFSVKDQDKPLKLFAKRPEWGAPKLLTQIPHGHSILLGTVKLTYVGAVPVTGLQYKSDPGLPITYTAFGFIICGVLLAAIPFRHVWVSVEENADEKTIYVGGRSKKAKVGFERLMAKVIDQLETELPAQRNSIPENNVSDRPDQPSNVAPTSSLAPADLAASTGGAGFQPAPNARSMSMEDGSANSQTIGVIGSDAGANVAAVQSGGSATVATQTGSTTESEKVLVAAGSSKGEHNV